jgi:hypothetical protein
VVVAVGEWEGVVEEREIGGPEVPEGGGGPDLTFGCYEVGVGEG